MFFLLHLLLQPLLNPLSGLIFFVPSISIIATLLVYFKVFLSLEHPFCVLASNNFQMKNIFMLSPPLAYRDMVGIGKSRKFRIMM